MQWQHCRPNQQSKKDCMEQNAEDCPDGAKTDKQEVKADCSRYEDCECKDVPEQAGNPSDEENALTLKFVNKLVMLH